VCCRAQLGARLPPSSRTHKFSGPRLSVFSRARGALISIPPNFPCRDRERLHSSDRVTPTVSSESPLDGLSRGLRKTAPNLPPKDKDSVQRRYRRRVRDEPGRRRPSRKESELPGGGDFSGPLAKPRSVTGSIAGEPGCKSRVSLSRKGLESLDQPPVATCTSRGSQVTISPSRAAPAIGQRVRCNSAIPRTASLRSPSTLV
jgi:hypothetical protein